MVDRGIGDTKRDYVTKAEFLLFVDREESVTQTQVQTEFKMTAQGAMWHKGLLEPAGIESGRWVLSFTGADYVEYLKKQKN